MARCDRCGKRLRQSFTVSPTTDRSHTFDSFVVRDLDARSRVRALQVQDHRPWGGGERQILLLRPTAQRSRGSGGLRDREDARAADHRSGWGEQRAAARGRVGRASAKRRSVRPQAPPAEGRARDPSSLRLQCGEEDLHVGAGARSRCRCGYARPTASRTHTPSTNRAPTLFPHPSS
jgi:hypothetical protein